MRRKRFVTTLAMIGLLCGFAPAAPADEKAELTVVADEEAELTVVIEAIREAKGSIHIGVWSDPDSFGERDGRVAGATAPVRGETQTLTIKGLPPGKYAIAVYHDENDNGDFDLSWVGLPAEGLGFSNGAWITVLGKPSFESAAIELKGPGTQTVIPLKY